MPDLASAVDSVTHGVENSTTSGGECVVVPLPSVELPTTVAAVVATASICGGGGGVRFGDDALFGLLDVTGVSGLRLACNAPRLE